MTNKKRNLYISLYLIFSLALLIAVLNGKFSNTQEKVTKTLIAGPVEASETKEAKEPSPESKEMLENYLHPEKKEESITLFIDTNKHPPSDKLIENFNEMIHVNEEQQGSGLVPGAIRSSSVQVITIPFGETHSDDSSEK